MFRLVKYGTGAVKREISVFPYNSEMEREVLISSAIRGFEENGLTVKDIYFYFEENFKPFIEDVSEEEMKFLLFNLRGISVGEEIPQKISCKNCQKVTDSPLVIADLIKMPLSSDNDIKLNKVNFYFKDTFQNSKEEDYIFKVELREENIPQNLKGKIKVINSKDKTVIKDCIDNLSLEDYNSLLSFIKESRTYFEFFNIKTCPYCGTNIKIKMDSTEFVIENLSEDSLVSFYKSVSDMNYFGKFTKEDIYKMLPFERNIYSGLLQVQIEEYKNAHA